MYYFYDFVFVLEKFDTLKISFEYLRYTQHDTQPLD